MEINKKGIFFTMMVILLFSLFLASFTFYSGIKERQTTQKRVESMNNFLLSLEEDLPRKLFVSGFRSIFIMETKIIESGNFITELDSKFQEIFFNGTYNNENQEIMLGATFPEIESSFLETAEKINVNLSLNNPQLIVQQSDPWNIDFILNLELTMEDKSNLASWTKQNQIIVKVPIENFEDPVYLVNTNGLANNKIKKTPFQIFVSGSDYTNLSKHSENSYYFSNSNAPSFLNRLTGDLSADENGVESLVNLQELSQRGINVIDKSVVDYIYFSSNNPSSCFIQGMPSWFKLDLDHLETYNSSCT